MSRATWAWLAMGVACLIALVVAPFASSSPDGLETVAEGAGFAERFEAEAAVAAPMADYAAPGVDDERLATGLSGLIGVLAACAIACALGWALTAKRRDRESSEERDGSR